MKKLLALQRTDLQKISATLLIMLQRNEYMFRRKNSTNGALLTLYGEKKKRRQKEKINRKSINTHKARINQGCFPTFAFNNCNK